MAHPLSRKRILGDPLNCTSGHQAFATEAAARANLAGAAYLRRQDPGRKPGVVERGTYHCTIGGTEHWHLTSAPQRGAYIRRGRHR